MNLLVKAGEQLINLIGITNCTTYNQTITVNAQCNNSLLSNVHVDYTNGESNAKLFFTPVAGKTGTATVSIIVSIKGFLSEQRK